ncbi:MAG TPA: DUF4062 domain-containing protein [Pyrinomonadaceae bacterium]
MKLRPTIFLSGVSSEFASFRDAAEIEIQKKDCFPLNQPSFGVDYREIEEMLRSNLSEADALVHIVGFRFGFEPKGQPADKPRRSYTQMEYDIARELNIPVYVFLSADANVRDPNPSEQPEDAAAVELQLAYRQALQSSNSIYYSINDKNQLSRLVAGIPLLANADFRVDISRIDKYAPAELVGRKQELALLDDVWLKVRGSQPKRPHVLTFVALGGEGKTSLVAKWAAELAYQNWPGCDSAFAWSFYSQGTREQAAASSDLFLKEAITFFGNEADKEFAASAAGAYEKGQRLARIVSQRRALLILDGVEPLQYAPTAPTPGELKDGGIAALLKGLAADSDGLCIVTTRYSLPNLKAYWQTTAPEEKLLRLSRDAGVHLLKSLGVRGTVKELETLVEDVKGHALTLNLLGTYLRDAHGGDIRRRDLVKLEEADTEEQGGHAFRVIKVYEHAFEDEGEKGKRALAILRLLGLFDRPITPDCLAALLEQPAIPGLTDPLVGLSEAQRNISFKRLEDANLLTVNRDASGALISLDAHPLLREYFALQLRTQQSDTWRKAHHRVYKHLCTTTPDKDKPALEDLQPLYQAVAHGCQAGLQQDACDNVYHKRILRGSQHYTWHKLGAYGSELGALACFFEEPWTQVSSKLNESDHAWLVNEAAFCLRAIGRLTESADPLRAAVDWEVANKVWQHAAIVTANIIALEITLGNLSQAAQDAERGIRYADEGNSPIEQVFNRTTAAYIQQQLGRRHQAMKMFRKAEQMHAEAEGDYPLLYGIDGFRYCDLLLVDAEQAAWQRTLERYLSPLSKSDLSRLSGGNSRHYKTFNLVSKHATQTLEWVKSGSLLLAIALDYLTLARAKLYEAILSGIDLPHHRAYSMIKTTVGNSVNSLLSANKIEDLPRGLLTRAWFRSLTGAQTGPESAQQDLNDAWEIAERGPMRLHMADIHLYRARLFFREAKYPWESPEADLKAAEKLINDCGYHRRDEELADAKRVILGAS